MIDFIAPNNHERAKEKTEENKFDKTGYFFLFVFSKPRFRIVYRQPSEAQAR